MIKVISYGKKGRINTAQIVVIHDGQSRTIHVWHKHGNVYGDMWGESYTLLK